MAYNYVVTSQRPTAVSHAVVCNFTSPSVKSLIVAKGNRLEIHSITGDGVGPLLEFGIYGTIVSLIHYRLVGMQQDLLFVLTAKKHFCVLGYDADNNAIVSRATGCVRDRIGRDSEQGPSACADPDNRMIAMSLYERHLKLIPIESDGMRQAYNVVIEALKPIDIQFLHGYDRVTLCLLSEDNRGSRHLSTHIVDNKNKSLLVGPWKQNNVDPETVRILPIMKPMRGVVCFAKSSISYVSAGGGSSTGGNTQTIGVKPMFVTSIGRIDERGTRYAVGDDKGNLFVLVLICSASGAVTSLAMEYLGNTSICTSLCYLGNGLVFVGSSLSDSQLIKLRTQSEREEEGLLNSDLGSSSAGKAELAPVIDLVSTYMNIGPILDMTVVKSANNGQAQIVTCSGALRDGSLRVVRSGIGLHEQASIEIEGIKRMWSLRASDTSPYDSSLVQSFSRETRILSIEGEELSEGFIPGFKTTEATLYCGNLVGNLIVQVTTADVIVISRSSNEIIFTYSSPSRITVAEGNMQQVVIATAGSEVVYFECSSETVALVGRSTLDNDVACMSMRALPISLSTTTSEARSDMPPCPPHLLCEENVLHPMNKAAVLAVGMWTDGTVRLLELPSLKEVCRTSLGTDVQVRDIILLHCVELPLAGTVATTGHSKMNYSSFVLAGMGDGCVISYSLGINAVTKGVEEPATSTGKSGNSITVDQYAAQHSTMHYSLHTRRRAVLGARPISLSCFQTSGNKLCGFATCDRPTVIYVRNGQLQFSMVNAGEAISMTPFHSELFPDCLAISSDNSLLVCNLDTIQKVHVEKIEMEEDPHHICYAPNMGMYGVLSSTVGTVSASSGVTNSGNTWGSHQVSFFNAELEKFHTHPLEPLEHGLSIYCCNLFDHSASDSSSRSESREYIIVGTAFAVPGESEPNRGRILVFKLDRSASGGGAGKGASIAVDYDNIDDHAMSAKEGDEDGVGDTTNNFRVSLITERETNGAVLSLASVKGRLVAGINSKLQVFKWVDGSDHINMPELKSECGHHGHLLALLLKSRGDVLALGDILQSITMLKFDEATPKLEEVARDFTCNYMRAIEILDDNIFVGADDNENIFFVRRDIAPSSTDSGRLELSGEFHVGETINVFQHGTLSNRPGEQSSSGGPDGTTDAGPSHDAHVSNGTSDAIRFPGSANQSFLFGAVSGAIGTILSIDEPTYTLFNALQKCIQCVVHSIGGLPHTDWRNFSNDKKFGSQTNTVDGDLVEMFLDLSPAEMDRVVAKLNDELCTAVPTNGAPSNGDSGLVSVEDIRCRIEAVSRCH